MKLTADPGIVDLIFLLQLVDNSLADITEWSDVIGKDFYINGAHLIPLGKLL